MVSWGFAFRRGAIIWLWSIVWGIVGGIIGVAISGGSLLTVVTNPTSPEAAVGAIVGAFAGILIGALIASIGMFASIVKIVVESVEQA